MTFAEWLQAADRAAWGPGTLLLLIGSGAFLGLRTGLLPWRNLGYALRTAVGREARRREPGGVSPFSALMTDLAATLGTGNIVGVATALAAGGPGALVWMELSALLGLPLKFSECLLSVKYRVRDARGQPRGGPMYVMERAVRGRLGRLLAALFAAFAVLASFGVGNMVQSNAIAQAMEEAFSLPRWLAGAVTAALALAVLAGGIRSVARVASVLVPGMAALYLIAGLAVILGNLPALPGAVAEMVRQAFSPAAAAGGAAGTAMRWGMARGFASHEAGMGSAAISAACASTDSPVRQGYINMTGVFFDTVVLCTVTGLAICASGALDAAPEADGAALTLYAFETVLGRTGGALVAVAVALFAFSTILGWAYQGERALEYLAGSGPVLAYRAAFAGMAFAGAMGELTAVWALSDVCNVLMALPNLLCLLLLSGETAREAGKYQSAITRSRPLHFPKKVL